MNWNPFKRITILEFRVNDLLDLHYENVDRISELTRKLRTQNKWLVTLQDQVIRLDDNKHPGTPVNLTPAEKEEKRRLKRAAYARKYYLKKKALGSAK